MTWVAEQEAREALPGPLPAGERVLFAARPAFWAIVRHTLKGYWLAGPAAVLAVWPVLAALDAGYPPARALTASVLFVPLALPVVILLGLSARLMAKHTLYVATDRRVILHVGYVFTRTINLPLSEVRDLSLRPLSHGRGDLQLSIDRSAPVGYAALFPHVRLGRVFTATPLLRCMPDAEAAAARLADALMGVRPGFRPEAAAPAGAQAAS
ncbi:MAG: photosynthetic complex putative assembly protein PuhB [Oceanicaulis sp.]